MIRILVTMISTIGGLYFAADIDGNYLACAGLVVAGFALGGISILSIVRCEE